MKNGAIDRNSVQVGLKELFTQSLENYNIINDEILRNLGFILKNGEEKINMTDPATQYIDVGTPLSNMSDRNLPSPSETRG